MFKSRRPGHVYEIASRAAGEGAEMVVAVGGDGTINEAARGIINSDTALGVLPTGSGNGYASNMKIPRRIDAALKIVKNPHFKKIDVGSFEDKIFLVSCGIGWEAVIATLFEGSKLRGLLPYAQVTITTFLQYEPQEIEIFSEPGGWEYKGRPLLFSVTNMREYGLGIEISPDACEDDGMLDICLIPRHTLLNSVKYAPEMLRSRTARIPGYTRQLASRIKIKKRFEGNIHLDGTPIPAGREINIEVIKAALKVAVKPMDDHAV